MKHLQAPHNISFVNGINIAWINFGRDIGFDPADQIEYRPDWNKFIEVIDIAVTSGANVLRWWYHTNGSTNPVFDRNKKVIENPAFFYEDMIKLLDLVASRNLKLQICLWSFDMLKDQWRVDAEANKNLLIKSDFYKAYIDNALIPMVKAIGDHPGLYAWEIFNEPEGMTTKYGGNWDDFLDRVDMVDIQSFVNKTASAIRTAQPEVKITNGALGFLTSIDDPEKGFQNYYSDQKLEDIGGKINGYLDFYNIHYYKWAGEEGSPFHNSYASQKIDKRAVIAEYYPEDTFGVKNQNLATNLLNSGWHGSLIWSWTDKPWDIMQVIISNVSKDTIV